MSKPPLDVSEVLEAFGGTARLVPLPAVVMFPDGIAPLRVFEDRYVKMVEDAGPDDGLIATNGHIELLLYGLARARIVEEIPSHPYRQAQVELLDDVVPPGNDEIVARRMQRALELIPGRQGMVWGIRRMAEQIRGIDAAPGRYADAVAHACDLSPEDL